MKRLLSTLLLLIAPHVNAQFVAGQVLGAAQLNAALASPTITSGSINGAPIGQSNPKAVNATSVGVVGATSGTVSILPQSAAGTYNFNLPTTAGASGSVLTSGGGSSTPMTWTPQASLAVGSATVATQASTVLKSDNTAYYPMMGSAASNTNQGFNISSGLSFNPTTGLGVTGSITASGNVFHNGAYTSFNGTGYIRGDDASYLRMQGGTSGHKWTDNGNAITLGTLNTTSLALSVPIDLASGASNTYNSGASKWSYFSGPSNTYFTGSTGFYVNDQANTKNILTVLDAAPNNALVVGTTGTSVTGTLSAVKTGISTLSLDTTGVTSGYNGSIKLDDTGMEIATNSTSRGFRFYQSTTPAFIANTQGIIIQPATKLWLDGAGDTYITESSANVLDLYAGGTKSLSLTTSGAAVTGALSASGLLTANGGSPGNPSLATQYQMSVGTDIVLNPSGYGVVVSGSRVVSIDTTGLAVTGTLSSTGSMSVVPTTGTNPAWLFFKNDSGASNSYIGQDGSVAGLDTAYSLNVWNGSNTPIIFGANNAKVGSWTSTGLTVGTGAASTFGNLTLNGAAQANHGSYITFQRNSVAVGYVGQRASVIGNGSNAEDMAYFAHTGLGHYWYVNGSLTSSMSLDTSGNLAVTGGISATDDVAFGKTITTAGTTGAQTINKTTGRVNFAASAASLVVTNSLVTANSIVQCTVATNDATMKSVACVPGAGSITIYPNAAPTAETAVAFTVTN